MFSPPRALVRRTIGLLVATGVGVTIGAACSSDDDDAGSPSANWITVTTSGDTDTSVPDSETSAGDSNPASTDESVPASSTSSSSTSSTSTSTSSTTTTTIDPASVEHAYPVDPGVNSSFTPQAHANYQATDIFSSAGCGTPLMAPVTGTVDEILPNTWDPAVGDPATRGGNAVSIIGDDGVRYWMAHFQLIDPTIEVGVHVTAGQFLGEMGDTGRAGACHVHFGLSLDCPDADSDWWVRRGVVWPEEFLESWRNGENLSPLPALQEWFAEYPDACESLEGTPYPLG